MNEWSNETGFNPSRSGKAMTAPVVVAMCVTCDPDLTKVTFSHVIVFSRRGELVRCECKEETRCLRCLARLLGAFTSSNWEEKVMDLISDGRLLVKAIDLFEEGELCACRKIP